MAIKDFSKENILELKAGESKKLGNYVVKLVEARSKWTEDGDSATSVHLELSDLQNSESFHLTTGDGDIRWKDLEISVLDGDNDFVRIRVIEKQKTKN